MLCDPRMGSAKSAEPILGYFRLSLAGLHTIICLLPSTYSVTRAGPILGYFRSSLTGLPSGQGHSRMENAASPEHAIGFAQKGTRVPCPYAVAATGRAAITASVNSFVPAEPPRSRVACLPSR